MNVKMRVYDHQDHRFIDDKDELLRIAGAPDVRIGFEDFGVMSDGIPVVFDRTGHFYYLDAARYSVEMSFHP